MIEQETAGQHNPTESPTLSSSPELPRILSKYNSEEVIFLDVGPTQNALKGKALSEIFPGDYAGFSAMFGPDGSNPGIIYFQLGAGYPEGFKVRMPALKVTRNSFQLGLLEYSMLNPKNTIFRTESEKEFANYIPTTLQKVHFLQERQGKIEEGCYGQAIDTVYDFLFYLTGM